MTSQQRERRGLLSWLRSGLFPTPGRDEAARVAHDDEAHATARSRFEDRGELGRGGMGSVRKVFDERLSRFIAMKVLDPTVRDGRVVRRFREEAQIAGQLEHPNIVPVHDLGADEEGNQYFTMKLVRGRTLKQLLDERPPPARTPGEQRHFLDVLLRVMDAVAFAHSRGVLHRDLKPENIMVGEYGQVYLMDFGLAKLTRRARSVDEDEVVRLAGAERPGEDDPEGIVIGTLGYLSPEAAYGRVAQMDERTDVFGLGATLYEMLAGRPPYEGELAVDLVMKARRRELLPLDEVAGVPQALARVAMRALAADPAERFASVAAMRAELDGILHGGWHFPVEEVPAGHVIVREGDEGDEAYVVVRGRCRVSRQGPRGPVALGELGPGDVFGEAAALSTERRTATVEAVTDVVLRVVSSEALEQELTSESWAAPFIKALAGRFASVHARLRALEREMATTTRADGDR